MPTKKARAAIPPKTLHPPLAERGRMLSADDVLQLLPRKADGTPSKSRYWVLTQFLPESRHKLGRTVYWWESEILKHLDADRDEHAA
jgi:hypothetical protein